MTDTAVKTPEGWVFYDGDCPLCLASAERFGGLITRCGFRFAPLQEPWVQRALNLVPGAPLTEMRVRFADGTVLGGADALVGIARRIWWGWPLFLFAKLPGALPMLRALYVQIAANRNCFKGHCAIPKPRALWPLVLLPVGVFLLRNEVPAWIFMWTLTLAIFLGCKWTTWRRAAHGTKTPYWKLPGYFFAWPGLDAEAFVGTRNINNPAKAPKFKTWAFAVMKTLAGAMITWLAAKETLGLVALATGWLGILGIILTLHFGVAELLALAWRSVGVNCTPLMRAPITATSLAEFWGRRWNTAFNRIAHDLVFKPLARGHGVAAAATGVFLASGLVHELVISVSARGGYGLPTLYFAIQGLGVLVERTHLARRIGFGKGARGWSFTAAVLVLPLGLLCPPVFIHNVILPMLRALNGN